jgi:TolA-binding protein
MTDDSLRELATQLPYDRPGADRTESVRASLLASAAVPAQPTPRRWLLVGGGFAVGAFAAAAIAIVVLRPSSPPSHEAYARIESSSAAAVEHTLTATPSGGTDEIVRIHAGTLHLAVPAPRAGDRVRIATSDAEIEGAGEYEVVVAAEALSRVTVTAGSATIRVVGKQDAVFLAAGQTWRASIQTADLTPVVPAPSSGATTASGSPIETSLDGTSSARTPAAGAAAPSATGPTGSTTANGSPIETTLDGVSSSPPPGASRVTVSSSRSVQERPSGRTNPATSASTGRATASSPPTAPPTARATTSSPPTASTSRTATSPRTTSPSPPTADGSPLEAELAPPTRPAVTAPQLTADAAPQAPPTKPGSEIERHFRAGTALLRANKLAEAVVELGAAADAGDSALAADARYYQAVALVKAKRGPEAERALVQFLDHAPTSIRRGRAAMMLGRLLADRGDAKTARDWFEVAAKDSDATVAAAAQAALKVR